MELAGEKRHLYWATNSVIALNLAAAVYQAVKRPLSVLVPTKASLIDMGANFGLLTLSGEYWRLLTCMFVHVGIIHLLINMYSLYAVGPIAESLFGWRIFLLIYAFSGVIAALASSMHDPFALSAGASGAIFGVYGSLLAFMFVQREKYPPAMLHYHTLFACGLLALTLLYGVLMPGIDNFAHFGGFISGVLAGLLLARVEVQERWRAAYAIPIMLLIAGATAATARSTFETRGFEEYRTGVVALNKRDFGEAVTRLSRFTVRNPGETQGYGLRGIAYSKLGDLRSAERDFSKVIALAPDSFEAYNSRAWIEDGLYNFGNAIKDATISLELNPKSAATYDTRGYAYGKLGQADKALKDFAQGLQYEPKDPGCHYHRMKLYEQLGRKTEAAGDLALSKNYEPEPWEH